jgi:hypothetical protein
MTPRIVAPPKVHPSRLSPSWTSPDWPSGKGWSCYAPSGTLPLVAQTARSRRFQSIHEPQSRQPFGLRFAPALTPRYHILRCRKYDHYIRHGHRDDFQWVDYSHRGQACATPELRFTEHADRRRTLRGGFRRPPKSKRKSSRCEMSAHCGFEFARVKTKKQIPQGSLVKEGLRISAYTLPDRSENLGHH